MRLAAGCPLSWPPVHLPPPRLFLLQYAATGSEGEAFKLEQMGLAMEGHNGPIVGERLNRLSYLGPRDKQTFHVPYDKISTSALPFIGCHSAVILQWTVACESDVIAVALGHGKKMEERSSRARF